MYKLSKGEMDRISQLFDGWDETLIWSCLQGYMGDAWVNDYANPKSVQIITGDFCFFAGVPHIELIKNIPDTFQSKYILMVPQNEEWSVLIEQEYRDKSTRFVRYAIKKEPDVFDREKLQANVEMLPSEYVLRKIDEEMYYETLKEEWSRSLCCEFSSYEDYADYGLGFVLIHNGSIVAGASSYSAYDSGIEIEIDTREDHRRKGLALICASKLIIECLERKLYPSWDAANKESVALAEKLGYHFDKEYVTYSILVKA